MSTYCEHHGHFLVAACPVCAAVDEAPAIDANQCGKDAEIARLREEVQRLSAYLEVDGDALQGKADTIARLRAENDALLAKLAEASEEDGQSRFNRVLAHGRAALGAIANCHYALEVHKKVLLEELEKFDAIDAARQQEDEKS